MQQEIEFTARMEGADVVWEDADGNPAKDHKLRAGKGAPPQTVVFKLNDTTGLGLRFDEAPFDAWEQAGCPPPGIATDQIQIVQSGHDRVRIVNLNTGAPRMLQYQLNVVGKDGERRSCDPIIVNDGGGPGVA